MIFISHLCAKLKAFFSPALPSADQVWLEKGGDAVHAYWMFAAPVNLLIGRDTVFLSSPAPVAVSSEESAVLIASLNQHFSEDGYHFYEQAGLWFLGLDADPSISTSPITQVEGNDIAGHLPQGEGALIWNKLQNEIQMLLFSHAVNVEREAQGLPAINGLWCYGLGATQS